MLSDEVLKLDKQIVNITKKYTYMENYYYKEKYLKSDLKKLEILRQKQRELCGAAHGDILTVSSLIKVIESVVNRVKKC